MTKQRLKQTEIGEIPEDWEVSNLSSTSTLKGRIGWQGLTTKEYLKKGDYCLVTGTDFEKGRIIWDRCVFVSKERYEQDKNIQLQEKDILITKDGSIGKIAFIDKLRQRTTLNSGIFVVRPINNAYNPRFMYWVMNSKFFNNFIGKLKGGSTISHLYQRDFVNFKFPLPPLSEQRSISEILNYCEERIDIVERERVSESNGSRWAS